LVGSSAYFKETAQKFEDLLEGKIQVKFLEEVLCACSELLTGAFGKVTIDSIVIESL